MRYLIAVIALFFPANLVVAQKPITQSIGPCLAVAVRGNVILGPAVTFCKGNPSSMKMADHYKWVVPQLGYAFDQAERAQCGHMGCLGRVAVTIFIVPNGLPNAAVRRDLAQLSLFVNSGLIDFIDATARSLQSDVKKVQNHQPPTGGFGDWMMSMVRSGGKHCSYHVSFPTPEVAEADFVQEQTFATSMYQVVLGHELSHVLTPHYQCNRPGADPLSLEMSCDRIAENHLLRVQSPTFFPLPAVAWMMAMEYYIRLTDPLYHDLYESPNAPPTFQAMFPATDFRSRAKQLVSEWKSYCDSGAQSPMCPAGYDDVINIAAGMTTKPGPNSCSRDAASNAIASQSLCASLDKAISLSPGRFSPIRGTSRTDGLWDSTLDFPGFARCTVLSDGDPQDASLICHTPDAAFSSIEATLRACLTGWNESTHQDKDGYVHAEFMKEGSSTHVREWQSKQGGTSLSVEDD